MCTKLGQVGLLDPCVHASGVLSSAYWLEAHGNTELICIGLIAAYVKPDWICALLQAHKLSSCRTAAMPNTIRVAFHR